MAGRDDGGVLTFEGVTRQTVLWLVREKLQLPMIERRVSLAEFHAADEVFTTGLRCCLTYIHYW